MGLTVTMGEGSFALKEPDEWYAATINRIEEGEDYGYGPTIRFVLWIDDDENDEGVQRETWAMCSTSLTPRSKLYGWVKGIDAGIIPAKGQPLDLGLLEGRRVDVMFEHVEKEGVTRERVTKIRGSKKPASKIRAAVQGNLTVASVPEEDPF